MDENARAYNQIADQWDDARRARPVDPCVAALANQLPADASVLDVGCGSGYPIDTYLTRRGCRVTGIDPAENMLAKAASLRLEGARFISADLLGFETDETFDAVIAFDSIFHIPLARQAEIYPKVAALLKPGGLFLFTHGVKRGTVRGAMFGESFSYSALDKDVMLKLLHEARLDIVELHENYRDPITGTRDILVLAGKRQNPTG